MIKNEVSISLKKRRTPRGIAEAIKAGWHFVRKNQFYPLLSLGGATFEGIFYGTIWFVIPLQIASRTPSLIGGLELGIYEIMILTPKIEQVILSEKISEYEIQDLAVTNGMVTMVQDGLLKAKDGITTIEEVFRVAK